MEGNHGTETYTDRFVSREIKDSMLGAMIVL